MRTQTARVIELDDAAWQLPRVDPTGWLVSGPVAGAGGVTGDHAGRPDRPAESAGATGPAPEPSPGATGHVRPRRPRRTAEARMARDLELARRRRHRRGREWLWRRQGRVLAIDPATGPAVGATSAMVLSAPGVAAGTADRIGSGPPDGWLAGGAGSVRPVVASGHRLAAPVARAGDRMGRWERLALTLLVGATLVLVAFRLLGALTAGPEASVDVTVKPGDTLWSIATTAAPDRDPRAVIDEIRRLNQVTGDLVRAGEVLRVPASPDQGSAG